MTKLEAFELLNLHNLHAKLENICKNVDQNILFKSVALF